MHLYNGTATTGGRNRLCIAASPQQQQAVQQQHQAAMQAIQRNQQQQQQQQQLLQGRPPGGNGQMMQQYGKAGNVGGLQRPVTGRGRVSRLLDRTANENQRPGDETVVPGDHLGHHPRSSGSDHANTEQSRHGCHRQATFGGAAQIEDSQGHFTEARPGIRDHRAIQAKRRYQADAKHGVDDERNHRDAHAIILPVDHRLECSNAVADQQQPGQHEGGLDGGNGAEVALPVHQRDDFTRADQPDARDDNLCQTSFDASLRAS
ncbi:MAG: hypothetical protein WDW38_001893 [Sanguina aurantia]